MTVGCPPVHLDLQEWDRFCNQHDDAYELVRGIPTVAPSEAGTNLNAAQILARILHRHAGSEFRALPGYGVLLSAHDGESTVRQPDLVVLPRAVDISEPRVRACDVTLVVEVVSPSSIERDWITKRAEYAAAGIPAYLVIDVSAPVPTLTLFNRIEGEGHGVRYADPDGDGLQVLLAIGPYDVRVAAATLLD